jgi:hypothetical protein
MQQQSNVKLSQHTGSKNWVSVGESSQLLSEMLMKKIKTYSREGSGTEEYVNHRSDCNAAM